MADDRSTWAARYEAGETCQQIAAAVGASTMTVWRHVKASGVQTRRCGARTGSRRKQATSAWHDVAATMRKRGLSQREIAKAFGVAYQSVQYALRRARA